jgi:hypothetical protein
MGGYIAASKECCDAIRSYAAGFIFTTSLAPAIVAGALASLRHLKVSQLERARHQERARTLKRRLIAAGLPVMDNPSHIVPVFVGDPVRCKAITDTLLERYGIYVQPILPAGPARHGAAALDADAAAQRRRHGSPGGVAVGAVGGVPGIEDACGRQGSRRVASRLFADRLNDTGRSNGAKAPFLSSAPSCVLRTSLCAGFPTVDAPAARSVENDGKHFEPRHYPRVGGIGTSDRAA